MGSPFSGKRKESLVMKPSHYLRIIRGVRDKNYTDVYLLTKASFGTEAAAEAISSIMPSDQHTYRFLLGHLEEKEDIDQILFNIWGPERAIQARGGSQDFFFFISLRGDDLVYRIGVTARLYQGHAYAWYHHIELNTRFEDPQSCIPWSKLSAEEEAMWTLLVSRIYSLPNHWFVHAIQVQNAQLLIPYDLSSYEANPSHDGSPDGGENIG
jgi:hypothetical protein